MHFEPDISPDDLDSLSPERQQHYWLLESHYLSHFFFLFFLLFLSTGMCNNNLHF